MAAIMYENREKWRVDALQRLLQNRGLDVTGTKRAMLARLTIDDMKLSDLPGDQYDSVMETAYELWQFEKTMMLYRARKLGFTAVGCKSNIVPQIIERVHGDTIRHHKRLRQERFSSDVESVMNQFKIMDEDVLAATEANLREEIERMTGSGSRGDELEFSHHLLTYLVGLRFQRQEPRLSDTYVPANIRPVILNQPRYNTAAVRGGEQGTVQPEARGMVAEPVVPRLPVTRPTGPQLSLRRDVHVQHDRPVLLTVTSQQSPKSTTTPSAVINFKPTSDLIDLTVPNTELLGESHDRQSADTSSDESQSTATDLSQSQDTNTSSDETQTAETSADTTYEVSDKAASTVMTTREKGIIDDLSMKWNKLEKDRSTAELQQLAWQLYTFANEATRKGRIVTVINNPNYERYRLLMSLLMTTTAHNTIPRWPNEWNVDPSAATQEWHRFIAEARAHNLVS